MEGETQEMEMILHGVTRCGKEALEPAEYMLNGCSVLRGTCSYMKWQWVLHDDTAGKCRLGEVQVAIRGPGHACKLNYNNYKIIQSKT